jgi:glycosyltransferase involved in cell wall biosynthesis
MFLESTKPETKVSVITVCRNAEDTIENAINSVFSQTYKAIEYIIIDGNSTDNTVNIINKHINKVNFFLTERDTGIYNAMNKGLRAVSGDIVYFLNADDTFYDNSVIARIIEYFEAHIDIVFGNFIVVNHKTGHERFCDCSNVTKSFFLENVICQQAIFYRNSVFDKIGKFNEKYVIVGDYEFLLRALYKYNVNYKYIPYTVAMFSNGGISCSVKHAKLHQRERDGVQVQYFLKEPVYYKYMLNRLYDRLLKGMTGGNAAYGYIPCNVRCPDEE